MLKVPERPSLRPSHLLSFLRLKIKTFYLTKMENKK